MPANPNQLHGTIKGEQHCAKTLHNGDEVIVDTVLVNELKNPGADQRCGVNLVCRPSPPVAALASSIQQSLKQAEPHQYYYDASDLHLTLVEVCHSRTPTEASKIAKEVCSGIEIILTSLRAPRLAPSHLSFDARGCALSFSPLDGALDHAREIIGEGLRKLGILVDARYPLKSSHVTLLRYIRPLQVDWNVWREQLCGVVPPKSTHWLLSRVWVTWGPNWYGMRSRISEYGPCFLLSADSSRGSAVERS